MMPLVPGFIITGAASTNACGPEWVALRNSDGHRFALDILQVGDVAQAQALAARQMATYDRIENEHLVRRHGAVALADGTLALVLDQVDGGTLAQLLSARGQLTAGETVTTVAPLLGALADLHAAGVSHGDLAPGNVLFSEDGRPLIGDLGVALLMGRQLSAPGTTARTGGFMAPDLLGGAAPSPASDVWAMAALGWFCLTGAAAPAVATRASLLRLRPDVPVGLLEVLTACLAADPLARPTARAAAVRVFDAVPAESVALTPVSDPSAEITRRIRAGAASESGAAPPRPMGARKRFHVPLFQVPVAVGVVVLLVAVALGVGFTWLGRRAPAPTHPVASRSATRPPIRLASEGLTAPGLPRMAAAELLKTLVEARALAYLLRSPALLDLVYSPDASGGDVDRKNVATALKRGARTTAFPSS